MYLYSIASHCRCPWRETSLDICLASAAIEKLNLAGCSCVCELNLVSKISIFLTLKRGLLSDPKNGVTDLALNGLILEDETYDPKIGVKFSDRFWGQKFTEFFA